MRLLKTPETLKDDSSTFLFFLSLIGASMTGKNEAVIETAAQNSVKRPSRALSLFIQILDGIVHKKS